MSTFGTPISRTDSPTPADRLATREARRRERARAAHPASDGASNEADSVEFSGADGLGAPDALTNAGDENARQDRRKAGTGSAPTPTPDGVPTIDLQG